MLGVRQSHPPPPMYICTFPYNLQGFELLNRVGRVYIRTTRYYRYCRYLPGGSINLIIDTYLLFVKKNI